MSTSASSLFSHLPAYGVIICKECKYAIWPAEVDSHLRGGHHRIAKDVRRNIQQEIQRWRDLASTPSELHLPQEIHSPIPELALHDGFLCRLKPDDCTKVLHTEKRLREHWREQHNGWNASGVTAGSRGLTTTEKKAAEQRFKHGHQKVQCQRFFGSRDGSHYIRVVTSPSDDQGHVDWWQQITEQANKAYEEQVQKQKEIIKEGENDDVSPWLSRTRWHKYLQGYNHEELMAVVGPPSTDPEKPEPFEEVIWEAMTDVARISQHTVSKAGVFVRMEAVRTEKHQTRYMPLETYWDPESVDRRAQPWRQMLMFFVRTHGEHEWRSPPYKFTERQFDKFVHMIEVAEQIVGGEVEQSTQVGGMSNIQQACLDFCVELLNMQIEFDEYESAMVCALAVMGVSEFGWRGPDSYPPILSSVIKCAKFMVVQKAQNRAGAPREDACFAGRQGPDLDDDSGYESNGRESPSPPVRATPRYPRQASSPVAGGPISSPSRFAWASSSVYMQSSPVRGETATRVRTREPHRRKEKGCLEYTTEMMDQFMVRGTRGPMQWMLDLRTYGLKIHYNTTSQGHVDWCNGDELLYKKAQFSMAQFRSMVHGLIAQARHIMFEELLFCGGESGSNNVPEIPWFKLRDDPTNTTPGWSFLDDERTKWPVDGKQWLFEQIAKDVKIQQRFQRCGPRGGLNRVEIEKYMASIARFREKLLAMMHIVGGQPARGTELLSVRHSNTWKGGHRNIFIEDGAVVFVTKYHKGYALSGDVKVIHRYLPREVGALLVWYLWLVRPFESRIKSMMQQEQDHGNKTRGNNSDDGDEAQDTRLFCQDYGGRVWTSGRMAKALERATMAGLGHALGIQAYREVAIGISRRFMRGKTAFQRDDDKEEGEVDEDDIADLQAGHGSHVAGMVYARGIFEMDGAVASKRQQFRQSSIDWHRFLAMQSGVDAGIERKRKRDAFEEEAIEAQHGRWARLQQMNMRERFARMMKLEQKEGQFRGVQEEAIKAIQARASPVVAVMPTGTGKSVLFMLPAWAESGGTTIVIVPLIALRYDMQRRCHALGISCAEWESGRSPPDAASIVLMTPESALGDDGSTFINRLKQTRALDRIVIDECHVVLSAESKFRPRLRELGELARIETQMVLLTATLPVRWEEELWKRMSWTADEVMMFRMPTTRKNVQYVVKKPEGQLKKEEHDEYIAGMVRKMQGKGIVYCKARARVKKITEVELDGCEAFHGEMNKHQRARVLEALRTGKAQVVVATNALGMGVDIPDIEWIIHADEPRDMLDYAQESGRAGRDGRASQAILVTGYDEEVDPLMREYVEGTNGCRRKIPSAYLDGDTERERCADDEEPCDLCRPDQSMDNEAQDSQSHDRPAVDEAYQQEVTRRRQAQFAAHERQAAIVRVRRMAEQMAEAGIRERLEMQLWDWKGKCIACRVKGVECEHVVTKCKQQNGVEAAREVQERRKRVRFKDHSACYKCKVPQSMCDRYRENGKGGYERMDHVPCQWYGIMESIVFGLRHAWKGAWQAWMKRLRSDGVDVQSDQAVEAYLGQRRDRGGLEGSNLAFEFLWITEWIVERSEAYDRG